ncbi:MAG: hypothetical protein SZ59_C0003G0070 [candidate division TM6 bacterium GW2011_GWF2_28_16]|nr:MAG: hypothetical protein SZ59_C0003G0070 [candidate division TM6 bacterium GW2011_GWF2_28_16]
MNKKSFIYIFITILYCTNFNLYSQQKVSPFSRIEITSERASGYKDNKVKDIFYFNYLDNVLIKFADGSTAKCEELKIKINTKNNKTLNQENNSQKVNNGPIEEINLNKNIFITQKNKSIKADNAKIFINTKICKLSGNIEIEQKKLNPKDLPISTKCDKANLNLITEEINVLGNTTSPVSTVIVLENYPGLTNSSKNKNKKHEQDKNIST